jgi:hypothetical protein
MARRMSVDVEELTRGPRKAGDAGFAFLVAVTEDSLLKRLRDSLDRLDVPDGVALTLFAARGASNLGAAYNRLQGAAAASRYKAYIHQDAVVLNQNLVRDVVAIFRNRQIGLIGAAGCRHLPESCVWWDGSGVYGRVLELESNRVLELEQPSGLYERVEAVDGLCMITQRDLPWDEQIPGFHFYDVVQSTRYLLAGFDVIVPRQVEPWFGHGWASRREPPPEYFAARDVFRERYAARRSRRARLRRGLARLLR